MRKTARTTLEATNMLRGALKAQGGEFNGLIYELGEVSVEDDGSWIARDCKILMGEGGHCFFLREAPPPEKGSGAILGCTIAYTLEDLNRPPPEPIDVERCEACGQEICE